MPELKNIKHEKFAGFLWRGEDVLKAYVLAGYKSNPGNASKLKGQQYIQDRVSELHAKSATKITISVERIALESARIAFADITDVIDYDGKKLKVRAFESLTPDITAAIQSIKQNKDGTIEVKMHPKQPALDTLAKYKGMFKENTNLLVTHATLADLVNASYRAELPAPEDQGQIIEHVGTENSSGE